MRYYSTISTSSNVSTSTATTSTVASGETMVELMFDSAGNFCGGGMLTNNSAADISEDAASSLIDELFNCSMDTTPLTMIDFDVDDLFRDVFLETPTCQSPSLTSVGVEQPTTSSSDDPPTLESEAINSTPSSSADDATTAASCSKENDDLKNISRYVPLASENRRRSVPSRNVKSDVVAALTATANFESSEEEEEPPRKKKKAAVYDPYHFTDSD